MIYSFSCRYFIYRDYRSSVSVAVVVVVVLDQFQIRGPFLTSPLGANFDPRGEVVPQG
jgi:hypothetical protein